MSQFTVCRSWDGYCLLLDDDRIAGGKPDYHESNVFYEWRTRDTYGPVDELQAENAKLRELVRDIYKLCWNGLDCTECPKSFYDRCDKSDGCSWLGILHVRMRELGIEVGT